MSQSGVNISRTTFTYLKFVNIWKTKSEYNMWKKEKNSDPHHHASFPHSSSFRIYSASCFISDLGIGM